MRRWLRCALLAALGLLLVDCILIQVKYSLFTGGFLNPNYLRGAEIPIWLLTSLLLNATAAALLAWPVLRLLDAWGKGKAGQRVALGAVLAAAPLLVVTCRRFRVAEYLGDFLRYHHLDAWLGSSSSSTVGGAALVGFAAIATAVSWRVAGRVGKEQGPAVPLKRRLLILVVLVFSCLALVALEANSDKTLDLQLRRSTTGIWARELVVAATDFDGDGYGLFVPPTDPAPFDGRVHPFAVDLPGNGVDEDGIGGDLPTAGDFAFERHPARHFVRRPDFVLFVLETFRADNLDAQVHGRPVAPFLKGLRESPSVVSGVAYSHNAFTVQSLTYLFTGTLTGKSPRTLIDDFKENGYVTAVVSGQDEHFGDMDEATGMVRADVFHDARQHLSERISASASPGSLDVPWQVVLRDVRNVLAARGMGGPPLFLYVNLQDCHFPYWNKHLEKLVDPRPLSRGELVAGNRPGVVATYRNAAANVDLAVRKIFAAFRETRGRTPAFVLVGDHGESLFEDGVLGHGVMLCGEEMTIPFLCGGIPARPTFPVGLSDIRGIVVDALARESDTPSAHTDPKRWVFQYIGDLDAPVDIGAAWSEGGLVYDLSTGKSWTWGRAPMEHPALPLIHFWEQIELRRRGPQGEAAHAAR